MTAVNSVSFGNEQERHRSSNTLPILGVLAGGITGIAIPRTLTKDMFEKSLKEGKPLEYKPALDKTEEDLVAAAKEEVNPAPKPAPAPAEAPTVAADLAKTTIPGAEAPTAATTEAKAAEAVKPEAKEAEKFLAKAYEAVKAKLPKFHSWGKAALYAGIGLVAGYILKWIFGGKSDD